MDYIEYMPNSTTLRDKESVWICQREQKSKTRRGKTKHAWRNERQRIQSIHTVHYEKG